MKVLNGHGLGGTVIATDTITIPPNLSSPDILGDMHPQVLRDSAYTIQLERLPDGVAGANTIYFFTDGSLYPRGTGQYGSTDSLDLYFQETVSRTYTCADSITVPFTVEVCTGVEELAEGAVLLGPNPFGDVLTLRTTNDVRYVLYNAVGAELLTGTARVGRSRALARRSWRRGLHGAGCGEDGTGGGCSRW
ncbi:MAG: hypothetical protein IPL52_07690 [Flavobacteriales bacterium]|nr:hypothetical protein [Flavobacteriales bacterium]